MRSLCKDLTSTLAQAITEEKAEEQIRESIHVTPEGGFTQFTAEEAYLIAQISTIRHSASKTVLVGRYAALPHPSLYNPCLLSQCVSRGRSRIQIGDRSAHSGAFGAWSYFL